MALKKSIIFLEQFENRYTMSKTKVGTSLLK